MLKNNKQLVSIQYCRAFAAIIVIVAHFILYPLDDVPVFLKLQGRSGVILFFVVSGFVMVLVSGKNRFSRGRFLFDRFTRVVPMYWLLTLVAATGAAMLPSLFKTTRFDVVVLLKSLFFIPMAVSVGGKSIGPILKLGWTLDYEVFFYISFSLLSNYKILRRVFFLSFFLVLLVFLRVIFGINSGIAEFYTSEIILSFVIGMMIGCVYYLDLIPSLNRWISYLFLTISSVGLVLIWTLSHTSDGFFLMIEIIFLNAFIVFSLLSLERRGNLGISRVLMGVGNSSYSLYLTHIFVVGAVVWAYRHVFGSTFTAVNFFIYVVIGSLLSLIAAYTFFLVFERRLTRHFRRIKWLASAFNFSEPDTVGDEHKSFDKRLGSLEGPETIENTR